ncbi:MAG: DNA adenine methylase [Elusimicrobia bacterium]|nr:DNA adenine methylase [Elusimicrobiota bacterium]
MKYMGSKQWMLQNGLGTLLCAECENAERFVDLFAGSGAVACFVAKQVGLPVMASDLQEFSVILTEAIIARDKPLDADQIWRYWSKYALKLLPTKSMPNGGKFTQADVEGCRVWSNRQESWPVTRAYGGYYFSPKQTIWIDALRRSIPKEEPSRTVALAALINAASRCAASPGHTAQPFQPTRTGKRFLKEAWAKDIPKSTYQALEIIAPQFAINKGIALVADAITTAKKLRSGDVAFMDPPYSGVQYSRFYHVLETIAKGESGDVSGAGRYPVRSLRPQSKFSLKTSSLDALQQLLKTIAEKGAKAILTFPDHDCSNGLSGELIRTTAKEFFRVTIKTVDRKFSTLGGNAKLAKIGKGREARQMAKELILTLTPR